MLACPIATCQIFSFFYYLPLPYLIFHALGPTGYALAERAPVHPSRSAQQATPYVLSPTGRAPASR